MGMLCDTEMVSKERGMQQPLRTQTRIPAELADWLKEKAKQENRSMNGQIVQLIREAKQKEAV